MGYPAGILVGGFYMLAREPLRPATLLRLLLLACGASVVYDAEGPGLLIGTISASFLAARIVIGGVRSLPQTIRGLWQHIVVLGLMVVVGGVIRGFVAQSWSGLNKTGNVVSAVAAMADPTNGAGVPMLPWSHVKLTLADLEHQPAAMTQLVGVAPQWIEIALIVSVSLWLGLAVLAAFRRDPEAMALTWGPMLLLAVLAPLASWAARWATFQLPGTFYPLALCAAARLMDGITADERRRLTGRVLLGTLILLIVINISMHGPRLAGVVYRYAGPGLQAQDQFSQAEMDGLVAAIGAATVRVDIANPHLSLIPLVEFGRRGVDVQWGPSSWLYILAYRGWPPPVYDRPASFVLRSISDPEDAGTTTVLTTHQYRLVRTSE
jgi:hypothetical protein